MPALSGFGRVRLFWFEVMEASKVTMPFALELLIVAARSFWLFLWKNEAGESFCGWLSGLMLTLIVWTMPCLAYLFAELDLWPESVCRLSWL